MSELKIQQCRLDGRYDVRECLGRGSYAEVYLAEDVADDGGARPVVIKALNTYLQGVPDEELERTLIENFRNEATALDRVRHPNVVSRLGHGTAIDLQGRTFHYLVLEYMPGGDMQALCRRQPLTLERAVRYLEQVAAGLEHAHANDVIHRDVKPSNLLLTADHSTVKITDFGVAKIEAGGGAITRVGTDVYAAPEHHPLAHTGPLDPARALRPQLTPAADVYSLPKTAYMPLTGQAPSRFSPKPITQLAEEFAAEPWAPFVLRVLRRATSTDPAERHQTVREFREELRDALLPHTRLLSPPAGRKGGGDEPAGDGNPGKASAGGAESSPPPPSFEPSRRAAARTATTGTRPRIVVPVSSAGSFAEAAVLARTAQAAPRSAGVSPRPPHLPPASARDPGRGADSPWQPTRGARRWLVALLLVALFAGMLMATHYYVRGLRGGAAPRPASRPAQAAPRAQTLVGRELIATTDVNLRSNPNGNSAKIGLVDHGARVRVLSVDGEWYEVAVLQRARAVENEGGALQGWAWSGRGTRDTFREVSGSR